MELIADFLKMSFPAGAVLFGMYLAIKTLLTKEFEKKIVEAQLKGKETLTPIRLQAYERVCLFLERISPQNLVVRLNDKSHTVASFQQQLLQEIRNEYAHNMSQQVYMSENAWGMAKTAMNEVMMLVSNTARDMDKQAPGFELGMAILRQLEASQGDPVQEALKVIKDEVRQLF